MVKVGERYRFNASCVGDKFSFSEGDVATITKDNIDYMESVVMAHAELVEEKTDKKKKDSEQKSSSSGKTSAKE